MPMACKELVSGKEKEIGRRERWRVEEFLA
jgi:hypothetical protein